MQVEIKSFFKYVRKLLGNEKIKIPLDIRKNCVIVVIEQIMTGRYPSFWIENNSVRGGTIMNISKFTKNSMEAVQNCEKTGL